MTTDDRIAAALPCTAVECATNQHVSDCPANFRAKDRALVADAEGRAEIAAINLASTSKLAGQYKTRLNETADALATAERERDAFAAAIGKALTAQRNGKWALTDGILQNALRCEACGGSGYVGAMNTWGDTASLPCPNPNCTAKEPGDEN